MGETTPSGPHGGGGRARAEARMVLLSCLKSPLLDCTCASGMQLNTFWKENDESSPTLAVREANLCINGTYPAPGPA